MNNTLLVLLFWSLSLSVYSQSNLDGTYQLMTTTPKAQEVFTTDLLDLVEAERLENTTAIIKVGQFTWVRILSTNAINDPSFTPLPDGIIVIDPDDEIIKPTISNESNH